jgi:hypothetical protein
MPLTLVLRLAHIFIVASRVLLTEKDDPKPEKPFTRNKEDEKWV